VHSDMTKVGNGCRSFDKCIKEWLLIPPQRLFNGA
jgi:hypothetical protein